MSHAVGAMAAAEPQGVHEYEITLTRVEGTPLGMRVANDDQRTVMIEDIVEGGAIAAFNRESEDKVVRPGDRIVAVNAVSGDAHEVVAELQRSNTMSIRFLRGAQLPQAPQSGQKAGAMSSSSSDEARKLPAKKLGIPRGSRQA